MATKTEAVRAVRDVGYVTAGGTYTVERGKRFVYFTNNETGGATSMARWEYDAAVKRGAVEAVAS